MHTDFRGFALGLIEAHWPEEAERLGEPAAWLRRAEQDTARLAMALAGFVESGGLVEHSRFLGHVVVLPLRGPVAVAAPLGDREYIVMGQQFLEVLRFRHQLTAGFRMAEYLVRSAAPLPDGLEQSRALAYWAGQEWIHDWFRTSDPIPDLARHVRSPLALGLESDCLMQALLFLVLHECGHFALGHVTHGPNDHGIASFEQLSCDPLTPPKRQELAADAWAARALHWPNPTWQSTAIFRLFLLFGIAQAALQIHPPEHPYVHDRCAHLLEVLRLAGVGVDEQVKQMPVFAAQEYVLRARRTERIPKPAATEGLAVLVGFLEQISRHFEVAGGDGAMMRWMHNEGAPTRPW